MALSAKSILERRNLLKQNRNKFNGRLLKLTFVLLSYTRTHTNEYSFPIPIFGATVD